jgi:hypothetical protein
MLRLRAEERHSSTVLFDTYSLGLKVNAEVVPKFPSATTCFSYFILQ